MKQSPAFGRFTQWDLQVRALKFGAVRLDGFEGGELSLVEDGVADASIGEVMPHMGDRGGDDFFDAQPCGHAFGDAAEQSQTDLAFLEAGFKLLAVLDFLLQLNLKAIDLSGEIEFCFGFCFGDGGPWGRGVGLGMRIWIHGGCRCGAEFSRSNQELNQGLNLHQVFPLIGSLER